MVESTYRLSNKAARFWISEAGFNHHVVFKKSRRERVKVDEQYQKAEVILSIKNVSKAFPGVQALDRVSIDIEKGNGARNRG